MSFGFSIKLVILNPIYSGALDIYGHIIIYKCLFMTVDIRYEICTVNFLIYLHDIQNFCGACYHIFG